jgi:hypothetical protein
MKKLQKWNTARPLIYSAVLALMIGVIAPAYVHRSDFDRALVTYVHDKSKANEVALEKQRAINDRISLEVHVEATVVLFLIFVGVSFIWRYLRNRTQPNKSISAK